MVSFRIKNHRRVKKKKKTWNIFNSYRHILHLHTGSIVLVHAHDLLLTTTPHLKFILWEIPRLTVPLSQLDDYYSTYSTIHVHVHDHTLCNEQTSSTAHHQKSLVTTNYYSEGSIIFRLPFQNTCLKPWSCSTSKLDKNDVLIKIKAGNVLTSSIVFFFFFIWRQISIKISTLGFCDPTQTRQRRRKTNPNYCGKADVTFTFNLLQIIPAKCLLEQKQLQLLWCGFTVNTGKVISQKSEICEIVLLL